MDKLTAILSKRFYRWVLLGLTILYIVIYLTALGDIIFDGRTFGIIGVEWTKMFRRRGFLTFEPIYRITTPVLTVFLSPINLFVGFVVSILVGLNLTVTVLAFRQPSACDFNRSAGIFASFPALLAGGACCAPAIVLIFGLQMSTFLVTVSQYMIPIAIIMLLVTLKLILDRTRIDSLY